MTFDMHNWHLVIGEVAAFRMRPERKPSDVLLTETEQTLQASIEYQEAMDDQTCRKCCYHKCECSTPHFEAVYECKFDGRHCKAV